MVVSPKLMIHLLGQMYNCKKLGCPGETVRHVIFVPEIQIFP